MELIYSYYTYIIILSRYLILLENYKFYFGSGDGATTIFVNRTENDADFNYTSRTRTHVCLTEIE